MKEWGFGELRATPIALNGGFNHRAWHIDLHTGEYVVKQLNDITVQQDGFITKYENSETIAQILFEQGTPAVPARKVNGQYLQRYKDNIIWFTHMLRRPLYFSRK